MKIEMFIAALSLCFINECGAKEPVKAAHFALKGAPATSKQDVSYVIDAEKGSVAGITVGMTESEIRQSGWPYETRTEILEGDEYTIYDLRLDGNVRLKLTLGLENNLYRIESSSPEVRDDNGLGAGSRLGELKQAYPGGRLITGTAEGRFANFLTGTHLIFRFDHKDLDESCFDYGVACTVDSGLRAQAIAINQHAP